MAKFWTSSSPPSWGVVSSTTAPILVAMSPVLVPTVAARASRSVCAALVSILASRVVMSALSALSSRAVCVAAEIGLAASEVLSTSPRPRSALTRTTSPVLELTLVTAPPPPPPEPAMYWSSYQDDVPLPALSLLVSVSSPSSPSARTGLAASQSAAVPLLIWMVAIYLLDFLVIYEIMPPSASGPYPGSTGVPPFNTTPTGAPGAVGVPPSIIS